MDIPSLFPTNRYLIIGGTGSLGSTLVERLLAKPRINRITVFSRDETKQHEMRMRYPGVEKLHYIIGDVKDSESVAFAMRDIDVVIHAAALKHVPTCEMYPWEAVLTNILGARNIVKAAQASDVVDTVVGVSTDKGCQPINVYGATKFIQERMFVQANNETPDTRFISVLYGNVMGSRGSVIPVFKKQIEQGGPLTITNPDMTRFLISMESAVDTLMTAIYWAEPGEIYIPSGLPAARVRDIADVLNTSNVEVRIDGIRIGEKMHEVLVPESQVAYTVLKYGHYVITPAIQNKSALVKEYISSDHVISKEELRELFVSEGIIS